MSDQTITSLIEKLEGGPVYLTHKEAYDLAVALGSDVALSLANTIRKAFAGKSLDAALALAERVGVRPYQADASIKGKWSWMVVDEARLGDLEANPYARATAATPALALCAALLRAQSEARV